MSKSLSIEANVRRLIHYIHDMERGLVQIPAFQRDFVWTKKQKLDLFDSLKKGYPIGSILFWKPEKSYGESSKIGPYYISSNGNDSKTYILDGFQRLSTIFGCLLNPDKTKLEIDKEDLKKNFSIYYDLEEEEFFIPRTDKIKLHQVPLYLLIDTFEFMTYIDKLKEHPNYKDLRYRAQRLGTTLIDFQLPSITINGGEIDEAVNVFSRVNGKGMPISPTWVLSALSYDENENFRLGTFIDDLVNYLEIYNFEKITRKIIFNCIMSSFGKIYFDQSRKVEDLAKRPDFISKIKNTLKSIKKAVQFLFEELLVLNYKLLPYGIQLVFIVDFFNKIENPTQTQLDKLKEWFWITTYSNYFTIYSLSKQRAAYNTFTKFIKGEEINPVYNAEPETPFSTLEFAEYANFRSVRSTATILFMLNYSNDFNGIKIEENEAIELKINYLFNGRKEIEGVIPNWEELPKKRIQNLTAKRTKYYSHLITEYDEDYQKYFIAKEMSLETEQTEILTKRKELIIAAEKEFVEKLGLIYKS